MFFICVIFFGIETYGQKLEGSHWLFGDSVGLSFNQGPTPVLNNLNKSRSERGPATISDEKGNLLFYTDGEDIYNRLGQIMPNGENISFGDRGTPKSTIITKVPGSDYRYWVTVVGGQTLTGAIQPEVWYTEVDMRLNNGLGGIVDGKKNIFIQRGLSTALALADHSNEVDKWLIIHKGFKNAGGGGSDLNYEFYLVSNTGIAFVKNQQAIHTHGVAGSEFTPNFKVSPDSEFMVSTGILDDRIKLFKIAKDTGGFQRMFVAASTLNIAYPGIAFSPNSKLLYVADSKRLFQINLDSLFTQQNELPRSPLTPPYLYGNTAISRIFYYTDLQLAPNGKIYVIPYSGAKFLAVIDCPNERGVNCGFRDSVAWLGGRSTGSHFPVLNQTLFVNAGKFQVQASQDTICLGDLVELFGYGAGAEQFQWFRNTETASFSNQPRIRVAPSQNTTYRVRGQGVCLSPKDTTLTIIVRPPPPTPKISAVYPASQNDTINACFQDTLVLRATFLSTGQSPNFFWENGSNAFIRKVAIDSLFIQSLQQGVKSFVLTSSNRYCTRSDTVWVKVLPKPAAPVLSINPVATGAGYCPGQTVNLFASSGFSTYRWSLGDTARQINFSVPLLAGYAGGRYPFQVSGSDAFGCRSALNDTFWVNYRSSPLRPTIAANPLPGADGLVKVCRGDSIAFTGQNPYAEPVRWLWSNGDTTQTLVLRPSQPLQFLSLQLLYPSQNGCPSPADTLGYGLHPQPVVSGINGPLSVCPGIQGVPYLAFSQFSDSLFWQVQVGQVANPVSGFRPLGDTLRVNWPVLQTDSARIWVLPKSVFGCIGDTFSALVRINTRLRPTLPLGDSLVCTYNLEQQYRGFLSPGSVYSWTVSGGNLLSGQNQVQATVRWPGVGAGLVQYRETVTIGDSVCEGDSPPLRVRINPSPDSNLVMQGPTAFCQGALGSFSLAGFAGSVYRWTFSGAGAVVNVSDSLIQLRYQSAGNFTLQALETTREGCVGRPILKNVLVNPLPVPQPGPDLDICSGQAVSLGLPNQPLLMHKWTPPVFLNSDTVQNPEFRSLYSGQADTLLRYSLTSTFLQTGCSDSASLQIRIKPQPPSPARSDTALCAIGNIRLGQSQSGPFTYNWLPVSGIDFPQDPDPVFSLPALAEERDSLIQKTVRVQNVLTGCATSDTVSISLFAFPKVALAQLPASFCSGEAVSIGLNSPRPDLSLLWNLEPGNLVQTGEAFMYRFVNPNTLHQNYQLQVSASNANGCQTQNLPINLTIKPYPVANISSLNAIICPEQENYTYTLPGPFTYRFEIENGQILNSTDTSTQVAWNLNANNWQLTLVETTSDGCVSLPKTVAMQLDDKLDFCDINQYPPFIPNVITPNADGKNDVWQIGNLQYYPQNSLTIFDRWGKKVFEASAYQNNWGQNAKPGTYFYHFNDGRTGKVWKGWVEVMGR